MLIIYLVVGGAIGYLTNYIAIKMLFRPIRPINLIFFKIQGLLPKRKDELAKSIARVIRKEFVSEDDILTKLLNDDNKEELKSLISDTILSKVKTLVPAPLLMMLGESFEDKIKEVIDASSEELLNELGSKIKERGLIDINIETIVEEKVNALNFKEIEQLVYGLTKKELKHIERIGLLIGLLIGLVQYLVFLFVS